MKSIKITQSITERDQLTNIFFHEVDNYPLLTPEEEKALVNDLSAKGRVREKAREKLIVSNIRFAISIAKCYLNCGIPFIDLINEACIGLCRACDLYKPSHDNRFISYAVVVIRAQIIDAIERNRTIQTTHEISNLQLKYRQMSEKAFNEDGRSLSAEEFAEMMNLTLKKAKMIIRHIEDTISLDAPFGGNEDELYTLGNTLEGGTIDDSHFDDDLCRLTLIDAVRTVLSERDAKAVMAFYGLSNQSLNEVAYEYDCSYNTLHKAIVRGLERIRNNEAIMSRLLDFRQAA